MITYSITYEIITEESHQYGEAEERGFEEKDAQCSFSELVDMLEEYIHPSSSHINEDTLQHVWWSNEGTQNYDGSYETNSLHIGKDPVSQRAYRRALKHLGRL